MPKYVSLYPIPPYTVENNETICGWCPNGSRIATRLNIMINAAMIIAAASANFTVLILEYPSFTIIFLGEGGFYKFLKLFCF